MRVRVTSASVAPSDCSAPSILSMTKWAWAAGSLPPMTRSPIVAVVAEIEMCCQRRLDLPAIVIGERPREQSQRVVDVLPFAETCADDDGGDTGPIEDEPA